MEKKNKIGNPASGVSSTFETGKGEEEEVALTAAVACEPASSHTGLCVHSLDTLAAECKVSIYLLHGGREESNNLNDYVKFIPVVSPSCLAFTCIFFKFIN